MAQRPCTVDLSHPATQRQWMPSSSRVMQSPTVFLRQRKRATMSRNALKQTRKPSSQQASPPSCMRGSDGALVFAEAVKGGRFWIFAGRKRVCDLRCSSSGRAQEAHRLYRLVIFSLVDRTKGWKFLAYGHNTVNTRMREILLPFPCDCNALGYGPLLLSQYGELDLLRNSRQRPSSRTCPLCTRDACWPTGPNPFMPIVAIEMFLSVVGLETSSSQLAELTLLTAPAPRRICLKSFGCGCRLFGRNVKVLIVHMLLHRQKRSCELKTESEWPGYAAVGLPRVRDRHQVAGLPWRDPDGRCRPL